MGVAREAVVEQPHVFVQHRVAAELVAEVFQLGRRRQFAVDQQVGDFDEIAIGGQLLDRVAAVAQDAGLAVEERDGARRRASVHVAFVERDVAGLGPQLGDIDRVFVFRADDHGEFQVAGFEREFRRTLGRDFIFKRLIHPVLLRLVRSQPL